MALDDAFDRPGGEVLGVDPQPVPAAAGEVEVAGLVAVAEVAGPVPVVVDPLGVAVGVLVVALEAPPSGAVHDLADGVAGVDEPTALVEAGPVRTRAPVSGSITATSSVGGGTPSEPGGVSGVTLMDVPPSLDP